MIFAQKRPNLAWIGIFIHIWPGLAGSVGALSVGWLVVVARAVSRKTPIYFMILIALRRNCRDIEIRITISLQDNNWSIAVRCLVKCCLWVEELALDKLHRGYWNVFSPVWRSARRKKRQKLVIFFWMFGHVSFESIGPATWVTASWALKWFFSSVNAEVPFQSNCMAVIIFNDTVGLTRFYWILSSNPAILVEISTRITEFEERIQ